MKYPAYGVVSKGNGEAWVIYEKHMALSIGGGQAGQGYPCILVEKQLDRKADGTNNLCRSYSTGRCRDDHEWNLPNNNGCSRNER